MSHRSGVQTVICPRLRKYINDRFRFSLDINVIQKYQKTVLRNEEFRSSEQHECTYMYASTNGS